MDLTCKKKHLKYYVKKSVVYLQGIYIRECTAFCFCCCCCFFFLYWWCVWVHCRSMSYFFSNFYLFFFSAWPSHLPQLGFTVFNWMYFFYYLLFVSYLTYSVINSFLIFRFWYHLFWDFSLQKLNRTLKKDLFLLMLLL